MIVFHEIRDGREKENDENAIYQNKMIVLMWF
jgi:hypothetical protein